MNAIALPLATGIAVIVAACAALALYTRRATRRIETAVPMDGRHIEIDGERLHYVEFGNPDGQPVVFVHGLCGQLRNFAYLPLEALARDHRVILLDRPGSGYSTRAPNGPANIRAQADSVAHFIAALGLEQTVLVGHSLGGALALSVALDHPEAVARLALIAPLTHVQTEVPKAFRPLVLRSNAVRRFVSRTFATPFGLATSASTLRAVFAPEAVPRDFRTRGGALLSLRPQGFVNGSRDLVAIEDADDLDRMTQRYAQLGVPVDVLFGRDDIVLDWTRHGEALRRASPRVSLKVVNGGHMLPVTAPSTTYDWLRSAIAGTAHASAERTIAVDQHDERELPLDAPMHGRPAI
ncbi:alpha/beta fold hydrolase [Paraburkholderia tropica]|uniref:alpha/beta fold hydrolase n=1 Tax=Paraburkholderia tropica TaxID=92647 RepID=UPI002AAFD0C6|nr:alpha/beta fold hydrolase [Paraburkholderia tropica]